MGADPRRGPPEGHESSRQDDRYGLCYGWRGPQGGCPGTCQGHRRRRCEGGALAGLGKAIASVPTSKVMDVYNSMAGLIGSSPVPNYLYSQVNPQDAQAAYNALLEFKDVVKAAR